MLVVKAMCPNCGAPLSLDGSQTHVICAYCDTSYRVTAEPVTVGVAREAKPALSQDAISPEDIRRVKDLVLEGKRADAIAHYARVARIPPPEAETAVDQLLLPEIFKLTRQMPINLFGFLLLAVMFGLSSAGLWWSVVSILEGSYGFALLAAVSAYVLIWHVRWCAPKLVSTYVGKFGSIGRARVLNRAILRPGFVGGDGTLVLVSFDVRPEAGGEPFVDQEVLLVRAASLEKLSPGNVVRVRYDEPRRERVFPITPIQVIQQ